jgi:cysteinyl-tRNA synthetase
MWLHHGLLTINGQKMSKSLGNFITVEDALSRYSRDALKLFFLSTHYASSIDYSAGKLEDMEKGLARFRSLLVRADQCPPPRIPVRVGDVEFLLEAREKIIAALDEDFNTAAALGHLFDLMAALNRFMDEGRQDDYYEGSVHATAAVFREILQDVLGVALESRPCGLSAEDQKLFDARALARQAKDWKRSDELREALRARGILVEDGKSGQSWKPLKEKA